MDRKYSQRGYMDRGDKKTEKRDTPSRGQETFGPRSIQMAANRTVSRCAVCGTVLQMLSEPLGQCKCGFQLHSCRQCVNFDPASRFECRKPVTERIYPKDALNKCSLFTMKTSVEKETSSAGGKVEDARKAFENLFKK